MKVAFAHDFPMIKDEVGNVYSAGAFPYNIWKRYLRHFSSITVLAREGRFVNSNDRAVIERLSLSSGPDVEFTTIPNLNSITGKLFNTFKAKQLIQSELRTVDFLIARLPSEVGKLAIKVAKENSIPYLIELVGCPYDAYRHYGNLKGKLYAPISMLQTKRILKKSKYTIYVTKDYLQNRYPTDGYSINISNVNIQVDNHLKNEKLIKLKELKQRPLKIGMIGSLSSKYKGFDKAIKYISKQNLNNGDYEISVLGGGNSAYLFEVIKEYNMESKVKFDGIKTSGKDVLNWLDDIDLYIHPSLTEGLPRALIEALSRGCLAIGSNRGGIPELLEDRYIFDPLDYNSFKNSIKNVLNDSIENQVYRNIEKANEYTIEVLSERRNSFLEKVIEESLKSEN